MNANCVIGTFEEGTETWALYQERLEQYFIASEVADDKKKRALLLSICGKKTYQLISNLLAPNKPSDTAYDEICKVLKSHFDPPPSEIVQRYRFYTRYRKPNEKVADFLANLRELARSCNFGVTLDAMLRDRLVLGISEDNWQRRLLSELGLTLEKALKLLQAQELAAEGCQLVSKSEVEATVCIVKKESTTTGKCSRCLSTRHLAEKCPFISKKCFNCSRVGHIAAACRSKTKHTGWRREALQLQEEETYSLHQLTAPRRRPKVPPITTTLRLNGRFVSMEIDTGASASLISDSTYREELGGLPALQPASILLRTYSGEKITVEGQIQVEVQVGESTPKLLNLLVVAGSGCNLLGRDWLEELRLDWMSVRQVRQEAMPDRLKELLDKYSGVFSPGLGKFTGPPVTLKVNGNAQPKFLKARNVPFALKDKVEKQLQREIAQGILLPVECSEFASPIVPVMKADGSVRICGDFKQTLNPNIEVDTYPLPRIEELFAKLAGGVKFTKLDLSQAYMQLPLDEESQKLCTINTHKGLLRYTRLPFGVSPAVGVFQRRMECLLQGISGTACFIDDLIITGKDDHAHLTSLSQVLEKLSESGLKCKLEKCSFLQGAVDYLGHRIDASGLHPLDNKVAAITRVPAPTNITQLRSFLGMVNYYGKFLPNLAKVLAPLHLLLRRGSRWSWERAQGSAFEECKRLLTSSPVLAHFSGDKELILECDASPYGLGAVIMQREDGVDRPIAYASRSLHLSETKYSQLEKEALAVIFGVKKFHAYVFGRPFTLVTDHKPLLGLISESKPVPVLAASRIQRWALLLASYNYKLVHRAGSTLLCADALSRLPLPEKPADASIPTEIVLLMDILNEGPVTATHIRSWTRTDPQLGRVLRFVENGWPKQVYEDLRPYSTRAPELSVQDGCVLWGSRVVIPNAGRKALLQVLHQSHAGASRMKSLARSHFWWPGLDADLERMAGACERCQQQQKSPPVSPLQTWSWPDKPWSRIHIDYAGPFEGKMMLLLVDAHSKWMDVHVTSSATSLITIRKLRQSFSTHGIPDLIVSDNGTNFTSAEMEDFLRSNGIQHICSAPYHPSSNGLAERAVQTLKNSLHKQGEGPLEDRVARFLLTYRVTPHATTGVAPCELLMGRRLRTLLDRVRPNVADRVQSRQAQQKLHHDRHSRFAEFSVGEAVLARDFANGGGWRPGSIVGRRGAVSYDCSFDGDGRMMRRHVDQLRGLQRRGDEQRQEFRPLQEGQEPEPESEQKSERQLEERATDWQAPERMEQQGPPQAVIPELRRSQRKRTEPDRLTY